MSEIEVTGCLECGVGHYRAPGKNSSCFSCPEGWTGPLDSLSINECYKEMCEVPSVDYISTLIGVPIPHQRFLLAVGTTL